MRPPATVLLLILLTANLSSAATIHVPVDQSTIQAGIDAASVGDTVLVAPGTYRGDGNRDIDPRGRNLVVMSEAGASSTVLDCEGSASDTHGGYLFHSGETTAFILDGFTVTRGTGSPYSGVTSRSGGGLLLDAGASPTILNCVFDGNSAIQGGHVYSRDSTPRFVNCAFLNGLSGCDGGALYLLRSNVRMEGGMLQSNLARCYGGAIFATGSELDMTGVTIHGNATYAGAPNQGSGIYGDASRIFLSGSQIVSNHGAFDGAGIRLVGASILESSWSRYIGNSAVNYFIGIPSGIGGAISAGTACQVTMSHDILIGNNAYARGSALYVEGTATLDACTIAGQTGGGATVSLPGAGAGMFDHCILAQSQNPVTIQCGSSPPSFSCCDLYGNVGGDWVGCIAGQGSIDGNFSADPLFCDLEHGVVTLAADSPCLAAPGCGLVGALGQGCGATTSVEGTPPTRSTWGLVKQRFESPGR